jgi:hypothetical protein
VTVRVTTIQIDHESLNTVTLRICDDCMDGEGGECHMPGCAFWMNRAPDVSLWGFRIEAGGETVRSDDGV